MEDFAITKSHILNSVLNIKDKISRTPENIPAYFIKRTISSILIPLLHIFNLTLRSGVVPLQWKKAIIIPIYKKGDRNKPKNHKPVSQTSSFGRVCEYIISEFILTHLQSNDLLSPHQFGFIPNKSSCSQLLTCLHDWIQSFTETDSINSVIYTDFSKAFDSVCHAKLIRSLQSYGLNIETVRWIQSFLSDRSQQVAIGNTLSSALAVHIGVHQGSVLGPLLFVIFINDITTPSHLHNSVRIRLFADDAKIYSTDPQHLQNSLDSINSWVEKQQLRFCPEKCFTLSICKPSVKISKPEFVIENQKLSNTAVIKDLGIMISDDLRWSHHVNFIFKNASLCSYQLRKSFSSTNIWTWTKLYTTYLRPKLEYNTPIWSPHLKQDKLKIESIQKQFTRFAFMRCNIPFTSYSDRLYKINMKPLEYRRIYFDLIFLFKMFKGLSDINFEDYFIMRSRPYNIRGNKTKIEPNLKIKDSIWTNSFFVRSANVWNDLPDDIASATSLEVFKSKLSKFDLSKIVKIESI